MQHRKTLIFHIGDHKTGSTSIQLAFAKNLVRLEGHEVFYPSKLNMNALKGRCTAYGKAETPAARSAAAKPLQKMADRVADSKADFVLISAEALEFVPAPLLREIIDKFFINSADHIRVVAYVRPHAARLTSSYSERTKVGAPKVLAASLEEFHRLKVNDKAFHYQDRCKAWRQHFGDSFILRPMIRERLRLGSVVDDFVHHAFGQIPYSIEGDSAANESLYLEDLMRLKVLQRHLISRPDLKSGPELRLKVGWEFSRLISHMAPPEQKTKLKLHRSLAQEIQETYLDDARAMDRMFFDNEPVLENELTLAVEKAQDLPQSTEPEDYLSASELRSLEVMSLMVGGLLKNKDVNWRDFLHAKRIWDVQMNKRNAGNEK